MLGQACAYTWFRLIKDVSPSAHATVRVMDFLMGTSRFTLLTCGNFRFLLVVTEEDIELIRSAEVEERRRPPNSKPTTTTSGNGNGKRKAGSPLDESDDGLQRAVKKLVRQAQLEADSPTGSMPGNSNPNTNGNGNGQNAGSGTPSGDREPISRSSSRERPVFDAYPMPVPVPGNGGQPQFNVIPPGTQDYQPGPDQQRHVFRPNFNPQGGLQPNQPQSQQQQQQQLLAPDQGQGQGQALPFDFNFVPSPYTFPVDPTVNFPPLMPNQGPALDPAVESMLASYFPPPSTSHGHGHGHGGDHGLGGGGGGNYEGGGGGGGGQQQLTMPQQMVGPEDFLSRVFSFGWNDPASTMGMDSQGQGQGQNGGGQGQNQGQPGGQGNGNGQGGMGMDGMIGFGGDWGAGGGGWMA